MSLAELADRAGLPARTIRFYIARGLMEGPVKAGRDAAYTAEHLQRLEKITSLQSEGLMLAEIGRALAGGETPQRTGLPATPWWQCTVADDVVVWTRADMSPWRSRQVQRAISDLAKSLGNPETEKGKTKS